MRSDDDSQRTCYMPNVFVKTPSGRPRSMDGSATGTGWSHIDSDALAAIISFLEPRDVAAIACTCRHARDVSRENAVWGPLLARYFGFGIQVQAPDRVCRFDLFRSLCAACKAGTNAKRRAVDTAAAITPTSAATHASSQAVLGAVALEGLYTDGGMDMGDPSFWAGNAFQPNGWSIYCSRASRNVHCIAQLQAVRPEDAVVAAHRSELISLAADVAWLLFLGRMPARSIQKLLAAAAAAAAGPAHRQAHGPAGSSDPQAKAVALCEQLRHAMRSSLSHWSTEGLKQLLWQLTFRFKVLQQHQQQQQLVGEDPDAAAGEAAAGRGGGGGGGGAAAAAGGGGGVGPNGGTGALPAFLPNQVPELMDLDALVGALARLPNRELKGQQQQQQVAGAGGRSAAAPLVPPRLTAVWSDITQGRCLSGRRALVGIGERGEELQIWSRAARDYLSSPALECTAAVVDGITVSRTGEFTCPVACGALFLALRGPMAGPRDTNKNEGPGPDEPLAASAAVTAATSQGDGGADADADADSKIDSTSRQTQIKQPQQQVEDVGTDRDQESVRNVLVGMVQQPYVQALSDLTTLVAVEAAAAAGLLPPVAARGSCPGEGEWVEFQRPPLRPSLLDLCAGAGLAAAAASDPGDTGASNLANGGAAAPAATAPPSPAAAAAAAAAAGPGGDGILWPVVWFRFFPHQGLGDEGDQDMALPPLFMNMPPWPVVLDSDSDLSPDSDDGMDEDMDMPQPQEPPIEPLPLPGWQKESDDNDDSDGNDDHYDDNYDDDDDDDDDDDEGSSSITISSGSNISSGGEGYGGAGGAGALVPDFVANPSAEWEDELDFLYGIEGQPNSYHATAFHVDSEDEDDVTGSAAAGDGSDRNYGHGPSLPSGAAAAGSRNLRPAIGVAAAAAAAGGAHEPTAGKRELVPGQALGLDSNRLKTQPPSAAADGSGAGTSNGGTASAGGGMDPADAGAGPSSICDGGADTGGGCGLATYEISSELFQGVSLRTWLGHLTRPDVARAVLASVAEVAGVQAVRYTFQNVQTALQPSTLTRDTATATATAAARTLRRVKADGGAKDCSVQLSQPSLTAINPAATAATAAVTSAETAVAQGVAEATASAALSNSANAPVGPAAASGAVKGLAEAVFLPPDEFAERAFLGLPEVPTLLPPPSVQKQRHEPQHQRSRFSFEPKGTHREQHRQQGLPSPPVHPPSGHLCMPLQQRWCGNTVLLKLIAPEDRSAAFGEDPDTAPNIDVQFVALRGVVLALRPPLRLTHGG
ncbi:hypothetical protein Vafri_9037 [Volvox africanus]|uniref:F-box domain-containing protein n=1 Tax=Volvox africanus TaxID=51714 RepID=A0A8J4EZC1_9CHLO|nr:hypothetical protein Vafri_9037 [Volvox africanus]